MAYPVRMLLAFGLLAAFLFGCTQGGSGSVPIGKGLSAQVPTTQQPSGTSSTQTLGPNILSVRVGTVWEATEEKCGGVGAKNPVIGGEETSSKACDEVTTFHKDCVIEASAPMLNSTQMGGLQPSVVCSVPIPEAQLYYSSLRMKLSVGSGYCPIVDHTPYFYLASTSANFQPMWGAGQVVDCSTSPRSPLCYSGAGTAMAPDFPRYTGLYGVFGKQAGTWNFLSEIANKKEGVSNRWASNDMSDANRNCLNGPIAIRDGNNVVRDGYACQSAAPGAPPYNRYHYSPYVFRCTDEWGLDKYVLEIRILDVNDSGLAYNLGYDLLTADQAASWSQ